VDLQTCWLANGKIIIYLCIFSWFANLLLTYCAYLAECSLKFFDFFYDSKWLFYRYILLIVIIFFILLHLVLCAPSTFQFLVSQLVLDIFVSYGCHITLKWLFAQYITLSLLQGLTVSKLGLCVTNSNIWYWGAWWMYFAASLDLFYM
jgi:hypothetical protein